MFETDCEKFEYHSYQLTLAAATNKPQIAVMYFTRYSLIAHVIKRAENYLRFCWAHLGVTSLILTPFHVSSHFQTQVKGRGVQGLKGTSGASETVGNWHTVPFAHIPGVKASRLTKLKLELCILLILFLDTAESHGKGCGQVGFFLKKKKNKE